MATPRGLLYIDIVEKCRSGRMLVVSISNFKETWLLRSQQQAELLRDWGRMRAWCECQP
jgi:hypothetical protein